MFIQITNNPQSNLYSKGTSIEGALALVPRSPLNKGSTLHSNTCTLCFAGLYNSQARDQNNEPLLNNHLANTKRAIFLASCLYIVQQKFMADQPGLSSIKFFFQNIRFQPMVFCFIQAKQKWKSFEDCSQLWVGEIRIMASTGRLCPTGVPFSGFRWVRFSLVKVYERVGKSSSPFPLQLAHDLEYVSYGE